jgi:hypothetical protein
MPTFKTSTCRRLCIYSFLFSLDICGTRSCMARISASCLLRAVLQVFLINERDPRPSGIYLLPLKNRDQHKARHRPIRACSRCLDQLLSFADLHLEAMYRTAPMPAPPAIPVSRVCRIQGICSIFAKSFLRSIIYAQLCFPPVLILHTSIARLKSLTLSPVLGSSCTGSLIFELPDGMFKIGLDDMVKV